VVEATAVTDKALDFADTVHRKGQCGVKNMQAAADQHHMEILPFAAAVFAW